MTHIVHVGFSKHCCINTTAKTDKRGKHPDMYELPAWAQVQLALIWQLHPALPTLGGAAK